MTPFIDLSRGKDSSACTWSGINRKSVICHRRFASYALAESKSGCAREDQLALLLFLTIKSDPDVKQGPGFNPMGHPVMQSLRETAISIHLGPV